MKTITHHAHRVALSAGPGLPTEARLFKAGANETSKGTFTFDAQSQVAVMAAYRKQGTDIMIDLEHEALEPSAVRADSRDARGWGKLEVRNGDLWLTRITWTADGAARLGRKSQRYFSPAFMTDDSNRITELVNVALVAMPATMGAPALVAASRLGRRNSAVLATRVPVAVRARVYTEAARLSLSTGAYLRGLVQLAASTPARPEKALATVARALGLGADAGPDEVKQALEDLIALVAPEPPADSGATSEIADPPPKALSRAELAGIKRLGITPAEFSARKRNAVKRVLSKKEQARK